MLIIFITFLLFLFLLEKTYKAHIETTILTYKYRFYALRDELRENVMNGNVKMSDWVFDYLDSSIAKTIGYLNEISLYKLAIIYLIHRHDPKLERAIKHLERELDKPKKAVLKNIHKKFTNEVSEYLLRKHWEIKPLTILAVLPFTISVTIWEFFKSKWERITVRATEYQYSTLNEYCT